MQILIVGAGINGLCAAWALTRTGHRVAVFEAGAIPHRDGTSYDQHRLIRTAYGSQRGYTRMMAPAWQAWDRLWHDLRQVSDEQPKGHYVGRIGCLALSTSEGDWTDRSATTMDALGLPYERVAPHSLQARFPMLRVDDARFGLYDPSGGILYADRIMDDLVTWLTAHGVALHAHSRIVEIDSVLARVRTDDGTWHGGDQLLVTAGAWTATLLPGLAHRSTPLRQIVAYVAPPPDLAAAWAAAPSMLDLGGPRGMYLAPPAHGRGFKIGCGAYNRPCGLDEDAAPRPEDGTALLGFYRDRFQQWEQFRVLGLRMCRYANEPDQRFILHHTGATWALTGCSGHGFKFGPLMGDALALGCEGKIDAAALTTWVAGESDQNLTELA